MVWRIVTYLSLVEVARRLEARQLTSVQAPRRSSIASSRSIPSSNADATLTATGPWPMPPRATPRRRPGPRAGAELHGVPIAVKDLCNTAGVPTAAGMASHRNRAEQDATVVARLRRNGAVILGKLQMTEGAFGAHHPDIRCPGQSVERRLLDRLVVFGLGRRHRAGLCFASLGSDTGGSIRFPSTMNGLPASSRPGGV
jgi:amidase